MDRRSRCKYGNGEGKRRLFNRSVNNGNRNMPTVRICIIMCVTTGHCI